jgi:hypothetical protein
MTSNEHIAALEHKQERQEEVAQEKEKKKANLEITKNQKCRRKKTKGRGQEVEG